jgi:hypothetical protein
MPWAPRVRTLERVVKQHGSHQKVAPFAVTDELWYAAHRFEGVLSTP